MRKLIALLLFAASVTFAIGVAVERSSHPTEKRVAASHVGEAAATAEHAGEGAGAEGSSGEHQATEGATSGSSSPTVVHKESSETLVGFNAESNIAVGAALLTAIALTLLVLLVDQWAVLIAALIFGLATTALDIREISHQLAESRSTLVALASLVAALHLAAAACAAVSLQRRRVSAP